VQRQPDGLGLKLLKLRVKNPHESGAFDEQAGLNPVGIVGPEFPERTLWEAEPKHSRDRQAGKQNPVIPATPPDTGNRELQQQCSKQSNTIGSANPAFG